MPAENKSSPATAVTDQVVYLSRADERANVATHLLGFILSLAAFGGFYRLTNSSELGVRVTCLVFCTSMAIVYLLSTLSHAVSDPRLRHRLRAWDQGTIYLLIVGTYSPFIWQGTEGTPRLLLMCGVWAAAFFGFYSKVIASHRINAISTSTYLALGWLPAMPLIQSTPAICFLWMLLGGVSYSVGILFLRQSRHVRYTHAIWHIWVMLGSLCHCYAIALLLTIQHS